uniref:Uncharacterized protein n=1 Tax=Cacopsylla melanoneura TaxID=428564 RepID=A0A8D8VST5_9HEMI
MIMERSNFTLILRPNQSPSVTCITVTVVTSQVLLSFTMILASYQLGARTHLSCNGKSFEAILFHPKIKFLTKERRLRFNIFSVGNFDVFFLSEYLNIDLLKSE